MKRRYIVTILLILCFGITSVPVWGAELIVQPGNQVTYTVSLKEEAVLAGFKVYVTYDTDVFSLATTDGEYAVQQGSFSTKGTLLANATETGCSVLWYHTSNVTASGTLFTLTFDIASNAATGTYEIDLSYEADDTVNVEEELVSILLSSPSITIENIVAPSSPTIVLEDKQVVVGDTLSVPVFIQANTGFAGFALQIPQIDGLTFSGASKGALLKNRDTGALTVNTEAGVIHWADSENLSSDGEILVLKFEVSNLCEPGMYDFSLSLVGNEAKNFVDCDSVAVPVDFASGKVTVINYVLGDVDDDGEITGSDAVQMARHIVGLDKLEGKHFRAADIDGDGVITAADCVKIARYLVGAIENFS